MDGSGFLNPYPSLPSGPSVFQFGTFLNVALSESRCIFAFFLLGDLLILFPWCLSIRLFYYVLFVPIFCSKIVLFPCHLVVGLSPCIIPLTCRLNFFVVLECTICHLECTILTFYSVSISFSLPSFASTFWYISSSCTVSFTSVAFLFPP